MGSLKRYEIAYKSLGVGVHNYDFVVDSEFFTEFEGSEITGGNCGVQVQLRRAETMLEIEISIEGEVIVACDRCLEDCPVDIDYEGLLIVKFSSEVTEYDGEVMWLSPAESEINLAQYIYESIVLSLPYQRVHPEGECNPEMIEKFRIITGEEFEEFDHEADLEEAEADEEEVIGLAASELAKLQALKAKLEGKE